MTDRRKLIEMDEKKSHGAKTEGWNIMLKKKGGGRQKSWTMFVSVTTQAYPHCIVHGSANGGSKSCIFGMPSGQVVIGSVWDGGVGQS